MKKQNSGRAGIVLSMLVFGSIGVLVRQIDLPSGAIALARAIAGTTILSVVIFLRMKSRKNRPARIACSISNRVALIVSGAAIGFNWIFLFQAYRFTSIAAATLSYYFAPVFVVLLSPVVLKEKLHASRILWLLAALAGLFLIILAESPSGNSAGWDLKAIHGSNLHSYIGIGSGLLAAMFYASVILITKRFNSLPGLEMTIIQLAVAAAVLLPFVAVADSLVIYTRLTGVQWLLLLILGIVHTGLAYFIYFSASRLIPGQTIAALSYIDPVFAILFAAVFLQEVPSSLQLLGGAAIMFATYRSEKSAQNTAEQSS